MHLHPSAPRRRTAIGLLALASGALLAGGLAAAPASAAVLPDAITDVNVTPTDPALGTQVRTEIAWCVPDGTLSGDTFSLELSEYLRDLPSGFQLTDPADPTKVVADAVVDDGPPSIVTFTMTDYAETHTDVCGSAYLQSGFSDSLEAGVEVPFTFTDDDGTEFTTPVTPTGDTGPVDTSAAFKFGGLSEDEGHTDPENAVRWYVVSPAGPFSSVEIADNPGGGMNIDCATVYLQQGTRTETNVSAPYSQPQIIEPLSCTPDAVSVTVGPLAAGQAVLLGFEVDLDEATGPESHTFENTANVTSTTAQGTVRTDAPRATQTSSAGGGDGDGDEIPSVDIEKWSTTDGEEAGDFDDAPGKTVAAGAPVPVTMTIRNNGQDDLVDVTVSDATLGGPAMTGLTCDFSPLGGPADGTTWDGPFLIGDSFECTGTVPAMAGATTHANEATVTGTGALSGRGVTDVDPFHVETPVPPTTPPTPTTPPVPSTPATPPVPPTGGLAVTGADGTPAMAFAALGLLLVGGTGAVIARRRRRS